MQRDETLLQQGCAFGTGNFRVLAGRNSLCAVYDNFTLIRHLTAHKDVPSFRLTMRKHDNDMQARTYAQVHWQICGLLYFLRAARMN